MNAVIREMAAADYSGMMALWRSCEGVGLTSDDSPEGIGALLERNPGLSFVAELNGEIIGTSVCSHDGRRGLIYHLAVAEAHRRRGLGRELALRSVAALGRCGIRKCHIWVYANNLAGQGFWEEIGWEKRHDLLMMSKTISK